MSNERLRALELANVHTGTAQSVVDRAQVYYNFIYDITLEGQSDGPIASQDNVTPAVANEPGTARKRRTRAEMAAEVPQVEAAVADLVTTEVDNLAVYKKIQETVVKLLEEKKRDHVVKVLGHFDIPTFVKLDPKHYAQAQQMLDDSATFSELA